MKKIRIIFSSIIILFSIPLAVEGETEKNKKYQFIKDIYSESWALIIGINKYQNVDQLNYAVNDAVAVKNMLVGQYGFKEGNIKLITDDEATKDNILAGFNEILTKAKEKDRVVVFYAGHGDTYKLPSGGDKGYLIPVDGNLDDLFLSSIAMKTIYEIADMSYAKHILYLVDACYGGLTLNTRGLKKDTTPEYIMKMTRERGRQVITAGGKDEQVIEKPEWGHSAFTRNLIKGLGDGLADENMDGIITADELGGFIKNRVVVDVDGAHTPQKGRIGSDMGEFVFISETLDNQFADASPTFEGKQLDHLESEVAELKKLLKTQNQRRRSKSFNNNTASALAWVFPGGGHYYSGRAGKGLFFTTLEIASLTGAVFLNNEYVKKADEYNSKKSNYDIWWEEVTQTGNWTPNEKTSKQNQVNELFINQQTLKYSYIGMGAVSAGVWIWNILDVKKSGSTSYSHLNNVSIGINQNGQVEASVYF